MNVISRKQAKENGLKYYFTGKECINGHISKRRTVKGDCLQCIRERDIRDYNSNPSKFKEKQKLIYQRDKPKIIHRCLEYQRNNRDKINARIASDPVSLMARRLRSRLQKSLSRNNCPKNSSTEDLVGCSWEHLVKHIERQFVQGMSWENRGRWHIDHIVPLASAKTKEELVALNHFTNLRPIWATENRSKSCRQEFLI